MFSWCLRQSAGGKTGRVAEPSVEFWTDPPVKELVDWLPRARWQTNCENSRSPKCLPQRKVDIRDHRFELLTPVHSQCSVISRRICAEPCPRTPKTRKLKYIEIAHHFAGVAF